MFYFFLAENNVVFAFEGLLTKNVTVIVRVVGLRLSLLALVFGHVQRRFLGMHGSLANGEHCRIVHRNGDNGMEEEFPESMLDISCNLAPFQLKT